MGKVNQPKAKGRAHSKAIIMGLVKMVLPIFLRPLPKWLWLFSQLNKISSKGIITMFSVKTFMGK